MPTDTLKLSSDRKVTTMARYEKGPKRWKPTVLNAFGLPALLSCPGFTDWCKTVCYAFSTERMYPSVSALTRHNLALLQSCGSNVRAMVDLLSAMINSVNWRNGPKVFRWHWDGDIFSKPYAIAIAQTCANHPDVKFWLYTRSFEFVPAIVNVPNLTVYLSTDRHNIPKAKRLFARFPSLKVAACADTWEETETIMRSVVGRNAPRCPELTGRMPLVNPQTGVGACVECGLCIRGSNHVRFAPKA